MSIKNITSENDLDLYSNSINCVSCNSDVIDCKTMGCQEIFSTNLYTRNDDNSITRLNQNGNGQNGQYLKTNGDGSVIWDTPTGGVEPEYPRHLHAGIELYNSVYGGSTAGFSLSVDKSYLCVKNGNSRHITGELTININNVNSSIFVLSFLTLDNELRAGQSYGTALGYSSNNAWLFSAIDTSGINSPQNRITLTLQTVNRQNCAVIVSVVLVF